jgi:hypothetical protein
LLTPYLLLGLALFVLMAIHTLNRQWSSDYWVHQASVETLRDHLTHPPNELTRSNDPSFSYTPYMVGLALVAHVTGWASVTVLQLAAIGNLFLFLVTFELFVTELTRRRLASFFALLATLFLWGIGPWRWSGFLNLNSIGFGLPYPSMFATGIALGVGWALLRYADTGKRPWLAVVGVGMALVALTHPFTAVWASVMVLALVISRRLIRRDRIVPLLVTGVAVLVVVAVWPYYSFFGLMRDGGDFAGLHDALYRDIPLRLFAAAPGFYVVARRFQRDRRDPLALMLIGAVLVYAYGAVSGDSNFGRVLPLVLFPAHVGVGIILAGLFDHKPRAHPVLVGWIAVSALIGIVGVAPGLVRVVPVALLPDSLRDRNSLQPITDPYGGLVHALPAGTVVVAENGDLATVGAAYGIGALQPGRPTPFVDDLGARRRAAREILDPSTPAARRREVAARYDVRGGLCADAACVTTLTARDVGGEVIASGPSWTLIAFPPA